VPTFDANPAPQPVTIPNHAPTAPTEAPADETRARERALFPRLSLLLILVLAAYLRLRHITAESLWFDESASVTIAQFPWPDLLPAIRRSENTPPLYYVLLKVWISAFGASELSVRLPSAIFGVASVWFVSRLGRRLVGRWTGVLAALFMSVSSYQIFYSQEARSYALMTLLALWSWDEYLTLTEAPTTAAEIRYWLASVLLLYSHLYGGLILLAQNVAYFARLIIRRRMDEHVVSPARWVMLQIAVAAGFAAYVRTVLDWYQYRAPGFWARPNIHAFTGAYLAYAGSATLLIGFAVLAAIGASRQSLRQRLPLMLSWLLLPVVVPVAISILKEPLFIDRYSQTVAPALYLLAAAGATVLPLRVVIAPLIAIAVIAFSLVAPPPHGKEDWRGVAGYLTRYAQPGDYIMINQRSAKWPFMRYFGRGDVTVKSFPDTAITLGLPIQGGAHVWLLMYNPSVRPIQVIQRGNWRVLSQRAFRDIILFELDAGATDKRHALPDEQRFQSQPQPPRGPATRRGPAVKVID
jgi:mannosyltransferase